MSDKVKRYRDEERLSEMKTRLNNWKERFTSTFTRLPRESDLDKEEFAAVKRLKKEFDEMRKLPAIPAPVKVVTPNTQSDAELINLKLKLDTLKAMADANPTVISPTNPPVRVGQQNQVRVAELRQKLNNWKDRFTKTYGRPPRETDIQKSEFTAVKKLKEELDGLQSLREKIKTTATLTTTSASTTTSDEVKLAFENKKIKWQKWKKRYAEEFGCPPTSSTLDQPSYKEAKELYSSLIELKGKVDKLPKTTTAATPTVKITKTFQRRQQRSVVNQSTAPTAPSSRIEKVEYTDDYGYEDEEYVEEYIEEEGEDLLEGMDATFAFSINIDGVQKEVAAELKEPPAFTGFSIDTAAAPGAAKFSFPSFSSDTPTAFASIAAEQTPTFSTS